jgi:hypothetical protein
MEKMMEIFDAWKDQKVITPVVRYCTLVLVQKSLPLSSMADDACGLRSTIAANCTVSGTGQSL